MGYSLPSSSVHGIFQARILEWFAIFFSRGSSCPGIKPTSLVSPTLAGEFFTISTTRGSSHQDVSFPTRMCHFPRESPWHLPPAWIQCPFHQPSIFYVLITSTYVFPDASYILTHLNWDQDCREKYQQPQICRWHHTNGRKQRGTKEPLDGGEKGVEKLASTFKKQNKTQHSKY